MTKNEEIIALSHTRQCLSCGTGITFFEGRDYYENWDIVCPECGKRIDRRN